MGLGQIAGRPGRREAPAPSTDGAASTTAPTDQRSPRSGAPELGACAQGLVMIFPSPADEAPALWPLTGSISIGRSRGAQIQLQDSRVSRLHATIERRAAGFMVRDGASRHGTFVNGKPVSTEGSMAGLGDLVRVGDTLLLAV